MKEKAYAGLLVLEAAGCLLLYGLRWRVSGVFSAALAFPFEQLGLALRWLSLSGAAGNAAAVALYVLAGLIPLGVLAVLWKRGRFHTEDGLLIVLSALLFFLLYLMVNPGLLPVWLGAAAGGSYGKALLGSVFYAVLAGYLVLRALRLLLAADTGRLQRYLSILLGLLGVLFVFLAFGACFGDLLKAVQSLREANQGNEHLLESSYAFLVFQYLVQALPYMLDVLVVLLARRLLSELRAGRYSAASVRAAERLSRCCVWTLAAGVLANVAFQLLQLVCMRALRTVSALVQFPVFSLAFVLAALLLAGYIRENKQLKDDNDLFI